MRGEGGEGRGRGERGGRGEDGGGRERLPQVQSTIGNHVNRKGESVRRSEHNESSTECGVSLTSHPEGLATCT